MKLLLVIAAVVMMMAKSLYSHPLPTSGSLSNTDIAFLEALDRENKLYTDQSETIVRNALSRVPSGEAYEVHRQQFRDFLQATYDYKTQSGDCLAKSTKYTRSFKMFMEAYSEAGANDTAEQREMVKLLREQGLSDFMDRLILFAQRTMRGEFGTPSKDSQTAMREYMATHC